jgi:hypothetical protein
LWSFVHGYAMLLIEGQIPRNPDGSVIFEAASLMPRFGYAPDAGATMSAPFLGRPTDAPEEPTSGTGGDAT